LAPAIFTTSKKRGEEEEEAENSTIDVGNDFTAITSSSPVID
jgi:hypothetical protein